MSKIKAATTAKAENAMPSAAVEVAPATRYINRELSWLQFNQRVLDEASNEKHPLLERLRFLSISASNLDEFYMVRVAGLKGQVQAGIGSPSQEGMTPAEQLVAIGEEVDGLLQRQRITWRTLRTALGEADFQILEVETLSEAERDWLASYFGDELFPVLTPIAIDPAHPFPFIPNFGFNMVLQLYRHSDGERLNGLLPLPHQIERFVRLPGPGHRIIQMEKAVRLNLARMFPGFEVVKLGYFRVLRDSEVEVEEEAEDLVRMFESALKRRRRGSVIRLTIDAQMDQELCDFVVDELKVSPEDVFALGGVLGLADAAQLIVDDRPDLVFTPMRPRFPERIRDFGGDCFAAVRHKDIPVHHPYESFDVVVQFIRQATQDPAVIAIKQTLYRTGDDSPGQSRR